MPSASASRTINSPDLVTIRSISSNVNARSSFGGLGPDDGFTATTHWQERIGTPAAAPSCQGHPELSAIKVDSWYLTNSTAPLVPSRPTTSSSGPPFGKSDGPDNAGTVPGGTGISQPRYLALERFTRCSSRPPLSGLRDELVERATATAAAP